MDIQYAICGGSAIDIFVGYKTRPHKDLDVAVFYHDRDKIIQYMLNDHWTIYEPCGGELLHKINNIEEQLRIKSNIWCLKQDNPHYMFIEKEKNMFTVSFDGSEQTKLDFIEYLFNKHDDTHFLYARNNNVKRELKRAIMKTKGINYLAPELVLLYKSTSMNNENQHDFKHTLPKMNENQRIWLKNALQFMYPNGHEWIEKI